MPTVSIKDADGNVKNFEADGQASIFDELQNLGFDLPHGCLAGSCSACKVYVLEGAECLSTPDPIESNTLSSLKSAYDKIPIRLSCRAKILRHQVMLKSF
jgi:ferredoxin